MKSGNAGNLRVCFLKLFEIFKGLVFVWLVFVGDLAYFSGGLSRWMRLLAVSPGARGPDAGVGVFLNIEDIFVEKFDVPHFDLEDLGEVSDGIMDFLNVVDLGELMNTVVDDLLISP